MSSWRTPATPALAVWAAVASLSVAACAEPFNAPSEYTNQHFLCGPEMAATWSARISECAAAFHRDGSCQGVVGLRGTLQGQEMVVQVELPQTVVTEAESSERLPYFAGFSANGTSPYFAFGFELKQVGGTVDEVSTETRTFQLGDERSGADMYTDEFAQLSLRLRVGGESENFPAHGGEVSFNVPALHTIQGSFWGSFGKDGYLEGCFAVFGEPDAADYLR